MSLQWNARTKTDDCTNGVERLVAYKEVDILRGTWLTVGASGNAADERVPNSCTLVRPHGSVQGGTKGRRKMSKLRLQSRCGFGSA
jgi:hypothetical protein